jgi:hypothetical protein
VIRGFKIDPETRDLVRDAGGRLEYVEGDEATAQEITSRLEFFRGENFLDVREGVPYYQEILAKGVDPARVIAIVRQAVQSVPSIVDVPRVEIESDNATREAVVTWEARTAEGRVIRSEDFAPLIIRP